MKHNGGKQMKKQNKSKAVKIQSPLRVGNSVFIRTVTNYYTGRVVGVTKSEILLTDAAWVADTGRFADFLKTGNANEVEPYPDGMVVSVPRDSGAEVSNWAHPLLRSQR